MEIFKTICKCNTYIDDTALIDNGREIKVYDHLVVGNEYEFEVKDDTYDVEYFLRTESPYDNSTLTINTYGYWYIYDKKIDNILNRRNHIKFCNFFYTKSELLKIKINQLLEYETSS